MRVALCELFRMASIAINESTVFPRRNDVDALVAITVGMRFRQAHLQMSHQAEQILIFFVGPEVAG